MDLLEVSALVSILPRVSPCCGCCLHHLHVRRGLQDELDELWPSFSFGGESVDGIGFPCFHRLWCIVSRKKTKPTGESKIKPVYCTVRSSPLQCVWHLSRFFRFVSMSEHRCCHGSTASKKQVCRPSRTPIPFCNETSFTNGPVIKRRSHVISVTRPSVRKKLVCDLGSMFAGKKAPNGRQG